MKIKKVLPTLFLAAMLLLSACSAPAQTAAPQSAPAAETPAVAAESASSAETPAQSAEEQSPEPLAAPGAPEIVILSAYESRYDYDLGVCFGTGTAPLLYCGNRSGAEDYFSVTDDENYPALAAALRAYNEETEKTFKETMDDIEQYARGDYGYGSYPGVESFAMAYSSSSFAWLVRADETLVSFCVESYWNSGGAHPYTSHTGLTFDSQTGQKLALTDILTAEGEQRFPELVEQALFEQYPYFMDGLLVESVRDAIRGEMDEGLLYFTVNEQGVTVLINPYDLAAYAAGPAFVRLFFADLPGVFEPAYSAAYENWTRQLRPQSENGAYSPLNTIRYKSGEKERELSVAFTPVDYNAGTAGSVSVTLDGAVCEFPDMYCFGVTPVLLHAEGRDLLYVEIELPSDWHSIYIFDLSGESPHLLDELSEGFYNQIPTDPHDFYLTRRSYCMSTFAVMRRYTVSERGEASPLDELYTALRGPELTLLQDMSMTLLSPDGGESTVNVPAGQKLTIYRTDNRDLVDLISQTGEIYRVAYAAGGDDYLGTVNGVPLREAFEGYLFAG